MSWIERIPYERATGRLRAIYDRIKGPRGELDNILTVHSLRPHTLEGHMALYKNVLHHTGNQLPTWRLEVIGVYVSMLGVTTAGDVLGLAPADTSDDDWGHG